MICSMTGFGLAGFKRIFWLEGPIGYGGRLIGAAFLIPLIWVSWWTSGGSNAVWPAKIAGIFRIGGVDCRVLLAGSW